MYQTGYAGEYQGLSRLQLIQQTLRGLGSNVAIPGTDTAADYSRYPKQDIIDKLNEAQVKFVRMTECLVGWAVVEVVANQSIYRMPARCLNITAAKWFNSVGNYYPLEILSDMTIMERISNSFKTDPAGTCEYLYLAYLYGNVRTFGIYPKPAASGTTYSGSSMGVVTSLTGFTFTGDITAVHKTGYTSTVYFVDSLGRDMTLLGAVPGMMIFNSTDGSSGQITSIGNKDATNDMVTMTLSGGTHNYFTPGDSVQISVGQYGAVIRANGTEEYAFNAQVGEMQDISPLQGNFLLDYVMRPLSLDLDVQYPEIPADYHSALVDYAVWKLGSSEYNGVVMAQKAADSKQSWVDTLGGYK